MKKAVNVVEYITLFPPGAQKILLQIRSTIKSAAPEAEESISYGMPAYKLHGPLIYFAGYKNHIGLYPAGSGITAFEKELASYKTSKGAIQFPIDEPVPLKLIEKIVRFRVKENVQKAKAKPGANKS